MRTVLVRPSSPTVIVSVACEVEKRRINSLRTCGSRIGSGNAAPNGMTPPVSALAWLLGCGAPGEGVPAGNVATDAGFAVAATAATAPSGWGPIATEDEGRSAFPADAMRGGAGRARTFEGRLVRTALASGRASLRRSRFGAMVVRIGCERRRTEIRATAATVIVSMRAAPEV